MLNELNQIGCNPAKFRETSLGSGEWHGPCPWCGGDDRFVIFAKDPFPHWRFWCRKCHPHWDWIDNINTKLKVLSPLDRVKLATENAKRMEVELQAKIEQAQAVLKDLRESMVWIKYHDSMTEENREQWSQWGVPTYWQDYWSLGYDENHVIYYEGQEWHTPTYAIPVFEPVTWNVLNVKHRLMRPPKANDRYRPERKGLPIEWFVAFTEEPIAGRTLLVEGEKKAMVSFITIDDPKLQVVGTPTCTPPDYLLDKLKDCEPIYICLDPDARGKMPDLAQRLGRERCRIIELPEKIDDMIIKYKLDKKWARQIIQQGIKVMK